MLQHHINRPLGPRAVSCRRSVAVCCSFNFAESSRVQQPQQQGRRNRAIEKRQEQGLRTIVHGLCAFNAKQLQAVSHLLAEKHIKEIKIAMNIPPTNQGRRRQEGLVLKLLRCDMDDLDLSKLADAVGVAQRNTMPYSDTDVEQQLQIWIEGLLENEQEVVDEVYQLLQDNNLEWQQLRTWVRQLQQHTQQQQEQRQQQQLQQQQQQPWDQQTGSSIAAADTAAGPMQDAVPDLEVQELMLELAQQQQRKQGGKGSVSPATAARRSIRRMLKPLAVAQATGQ